MVRSPASRCWYIPISVASLLVAISACVYSTVAARSTTNAETASDAAVLSAASRRMSVIASRLTSSVVKIRSRRPAGRRGTVEETGSGVIIRHKKPAGLFVITNAHVIAETSLDAIQVHLHDGRVLAPQRVWSDTASDVAVLNLNVRGLQPAEWGDSDKLRIGQFVLAMGSPFNLSHSVSLGIISAKGRRSLKLGAGDIINQDFLQTDAAINPGNSGGPLVDVQGRIVGINTAIATTNGAFTGVGFSIPSQLVQRITNELLTYGRVRRAYLGVVLDPEFNAQEARLLKLPRLRGARVLQVTKNTPAALAGIQADDVVTEFEETTVIDFDHLINLVSLQPIGTTVTLGVWRGGRAMRIRVELTDRKVLDDRERR